MPPALAARVARSVAGGARRAGGRGGRRTAVALARVAALAAVALVAYFVLGARAQHARAVERARAEALDALRAKASAFGPSDAAFMARVEPWLVGLTHDYDGDVAGEEARSPDALDATLARPSVYVRGKIASFAEPAGIAEAASASLKDPFIACLVDPPASRAEKAILARTRAVYGGSALATPRMTAVHRLRDVDIAARALAEPWEERIRAAREPEEIAALAAKVARIPAEEGARAARAELLVAVMDEPDEPGPAELDGERAHAVRVGIVDLAARRVVLRARKRVDPSWLGVAARAQYASGADACALAYDVRAGLGKQGR